MPGLLDVVRGGHETPSFVRVDMESTRSASCGDPTSELRVHPYESLTVAASQQLPAL
jgi:hypothetical protein